MYYFAFGSNMDTTHFFKFISEDCTAVIGSSYIDNYIFKYRNIKSTKLRSGVANIEKRMNSKTYGVLYFLDDNTMLDKLDKKEGFISESSSENKYNKIRVKAKLLNSNKEFLCFTYQINENVSSDERKPRLEYIKYLRNGNRMHNLPKSHIKRINYLF